MAITETNAQAFAATVKSGQEVHILDVRTGVECRAEKLGCAFTHIPLHALDAADFVHKNKDRLNGKPLYILCRSGGRARRAAGALEKAGLTNLVIVQGGLSACAACDMPMEKGAVWSLERQVRLVAGLLVLSGALLGHWVAEGFYIIPALIGAGLVFAGLTDWCGMALLLTRAPWNADNEAAIRKSLQTFEKKETSHD